MPKAKFYTLVLLLALAGWVWIAANIAGDRGPVNICLFRQVTGIPCPACGTTRGVLCLLHGDPGGACSDNPFSFIIVLLLAVVPLWITLDLFRSGDSFNRFYRRSEDLFRSRSLMPLLAAVLVCLNWCWNILKGI